MNFEREHEGLGATEAGVISSDSEKSRSTPLRRDFSLPLEMTNRMFMQ
jgi:hypothetical protein